MDIKNARTELMLHCEKDLWSFPVINQQYQLQFQKISPSLGHVDTFRYMGVFRSLPLQGKYFDVFNLSGINTGYWNLSTVFNRKDSADVWKNLADVCRARGVLTSVYDQASKMYLRDHCWIVTTYDGVNLLAIEQNTSFKLKDIKELYLNCYTPLGDFYTVSKPELYENRVEYYSVELTIEDELTNLYDILGKFKALPGNTLIFKNGYLTDKLPSSGTLSSLNNGDTYELAHDPSVFEIEKYKISDLPDFFSTLDNQRKYIVHPPKLEAEDWEGKSFRDTDIYLVDSDGKGIYFDRNNISNIRQLTHRDMAVSGHAVSTLISSYGKFTNANELYLMVQHRSNRRRMVMSHEANYIRYLYRMDDDHIIGAMTDTNSTVYEWTADGLESSATMRLFNSQLNDITHDLAVEALGYNVSTTVNSTNPLIKLDGIHDIEVPLTYRECAVVFEYDAEGLYIGHHQITNMSRYTPASTDTVRVEFVPGIAGNDVNFTLQGEEDTVTLLKGWGWMAYVSGRILSDDGSDGKWVVAEEGKDYTLADGKLTWTINKYQQIGAIAFNNQFILREFTLNHLDNTLSFSITHDWEGGGIALPIAPADINVIMNNRTLIENVDYVINYPDVYIINKEFIKDDEQSFVVYYHGWSPKVIEPINRSELGFVSGGVIGLNNRYNLRENRVTKTTVYGRVFDVSELDSAEIKKATELLSELNGRPYQVKHTYTAVKGVRDFDVYYGYLNSVDMDKRTSEYLTVNCKKPNADVIATQWDKYSVFSPFMNKVINDIVLGLIEIDYDKNINGFNNQYLIDKTWDYKWMLEFDPVILGFDERMFMVHPISTNSPLAVTPIQFAFIKAVNDYFLNSRCVIEGYLEVKNV